MTDEQLRNSLPPLEVVTEEEWSSWKEHPTTKTFRKYLTKQLAMTFEHWVAGSFTAPEGDRTLQLNSSAIGRGQLIKDILELTAQEINQGMNDE